ncbi:MAG: cytochrome C6 [Oscillatoriales cyanobacterium CG2_30_44_21]|nr:MAG: cytochrome C6 [Oscillatoriales cyanobacterium CG2_30_44_21]
MKRIFLILAIASTLIANLTFSQPAFAELSAGAKIFNSNCASCHAGGLNRVVAAKTLKAAALEKYGMNSVEAISKQVAKGKGAMPVFGKKLTAEEITVVANYVLEQSQSNWGKASVAK